MLDVLFQEPVLSISAIVAVASRALPNVAFLASRPCVLPIKLLYGAPSDLASALVFLLECAVWLLAGHFFLLPRFQRNKLQVSIPLQEQEVGYALAWRAWTACSMVCIEACWLWQVRLTHQKKKKKKRKCKCPVTLPARRVMWSWRRRRREQAVGLDYFLLNHTESHTFDLLLLSAFFTWKLPE